MKYFNQVNLETPESVELEFSLAGIGNRIHALLIDYFLWSSLVLFCQVTLVFLFLNYLAQYDSLAQFLVAIQLLVVFAIQVGYFVFFETIWQGQTPGKRRVKIRVIQDDGRPVQLQQATIRSLLRPIDDLLFLGMFFIIFGYRQFDYFYATLGFLCWIPNILIIEWLYLLPKFKKRAIKK